MWWAALSSLAVVVLVVVLRHWLGGRHLPRRDHEPFEGELYAIDRAVVGVQGPARPAITVVTMHGFVEDMRYVAELYDDPTLQLVMVNSGDYHAPYGTPPYDHPEWATKPQSMPGTIRYDAEVLVQAMVHLVAGERVRVHGHSRGGAVVLEAAQLRPDLFEGVEVVLEAPVLPGAAFYAELSPIALWFFPIALLFWRHSPINPSNRGAFGSLDASRKRALVSSMPFHPVNAQTAITNLTDMKSWMETTEASAFDGLRGTILVPEKDRVLNHERMRQSAIRAEHLEVVDVPDCSHFVVFDRPEAFPAL